MRPQAIVFDLNGTLLDMAALDPHFQRIFRSAEYRERWFQQLQVLWMTTNACGTFDPFEKLARSALQMLAAKQSVVVKSADVSAIVSQMTQLSAYADVSASLAQLKTAGYRLAVLTNGALKSAKSQVKFAGISNAFESVFSVDQVERYKPAPEPYLFAAKELKLKPAKLLLVAAHAWDIAGAAAAGLKTAFVARPKQTLNPSASKPDYVVKDLRELVRKLA